jgi:hypothetical protein
MSIRCDNKDVTPLSATQLKLTSSWTSNQQVGEFARFEVRLPPESAFRFVMGGERTTVVKAARRKVTAGTAVEITTDYVNLLGGPDRRLARFAFVGIAKDGNGNDAEVQTQKAKFLP